MRRWVVGISGSTGSIYGIRLLERLRATPDVEVHLMVIAPCSIKTVSALANCHADTLIARAGDVTLKEGRPLLAVVRETPLHAGHLRQMLALAELGCVILPPMPA